jgi:hypothetical protein
MANRCPHVLQTTVSMALGSVCATLSRLATDDFTSVVPGAAVAHDRYDRRREIHRA